MSDQNGGDPESIANKPPVPPRDDLVNTAAKFLSSPNVQKSPHDMKISFLKKKGLSDVEIDLAFRKCDSILQSRALESQTPLSPYPPVVYQPLQPVSFWNRHPRWLTFRDLVNTLMLFAGVLYGIYWIYKKYIWNYLFGNGSRKKRTADDRLTDIEANLNSVGQSVNSLKDIIDSKGHLARELHHVKTEVASIKKMMLSRKEFPATTTTPLSIPSWQIASNAADKEEEGAATNGSDSSLEMIKE